MKDDASDYGKACRKALRLLLVRGRSRAELQLRLRKYQFSDEVVAQVIDELVRLRYIDDESFARNWARNLAVNKLWGNKKIVVSLREKGISPEILESALADVRAEISEEEAIKTLVEKRRRRENTAEGRESFDGKARERLIRNLAARGFPAAIIFAVLNREL